MKVLQPIEWNDEQGKTHKGIVTEILDDKQGVIARSTEDPNKAVVVKEPHKIRDMKAMAEVWKALGITPEKAMAAGHIDSKPVHKGFKKVTIPPPTPKTEEELKGTFDKALAELGGEDVVLTVADVLGKKELDTADYIRLHGMGFDVADKIPAPDTKTTPISKMFFSHKKDDTLHGI